MLRVNFYFFIEIMIVSLFMFLILTPVSAKEAWENQGLEWYYDNLTEEDRQKIRQAMDYAIPREKVIDEKMKGYALPLATDIASNMIGYDSSIQVSEFNLTRSKELLAEVFGKRYENKSIVKANATITNTPYFKITLIEPTTCVSRTQWGTSIATEFNKIGIETEIKWWNWNLIMPRIFLDPKTDPLGANYDHDGFDSYLLHFGTSTDPEFSKKYYSEFFVPTGDNSMYIERPDLVAIINRSLQEPKFEDREQALKVYQQWFFEWVPKCIIRQDLDTFPQSPAWTGFDPYTYGRYPWVHNMTREVYDPVATYTSVVPGSFVDFNPLLSNSWYDAIWQSNVFLSLAGRRGLYNLSHPYPLLAASWNSTPNGLEWAVTLREGVKWHDGTDVTVDDVIFSYEAAYGCPASTWADKMATWFDPNTTWIEKIDARTVKFTLQAFYPYVESGIFALPILQKAQLEPIGYANWKTDGTNTGSTPLIGCGPYIFSEYKYQNITCKKASTWNATLIGHNPTAVGGGIWLDATHGPAQYNVMVNYEATSAVTDLKNGDVQLLDPYIGVFNQIEELEAADWCNLITAPAYGWRELAFNHYDPRWGLNPHDPREMYPMDYSKNSLGDVDFVIFLSCIIIFISSSVLLIFLGKKIMNI